MCYELFHKISDTLFENIIVQILFVRVEKLHEETFDLFEVVKLEINFHLVRVKHLKKTHDAAFDLIRKRYAKSPLKSYFAGASTGGREGMTLVERFPQDYDGVIAIAPAINFSGVRLTTPGNADN